MREQYDKTNPDSRYHARWSRHYADRAILLAKISMALAVVSLVLAVVLAVFL